MAKKTAKAAENPPEDPTPELTILGAGEQSAFVMAPPAEQQQPSLFPAGELLVPRAFDLVKKGISALHSVPATKEHNHTLNSRRFMDAIAVLIQLELKKLPKAIFEQIQASMSGEWREGETVRIEASPMFRVSLSELTKLAGAKTNNRAHVIESLQLLHDMVLRWNVRGEDGEVEWDMRSRFLTTFGVGQGRYKGMVCFSLDPRVLALVLDPKLFVKLSLEVMHQLGLEASYSLYQQCWRYINTVHKVTAAWPVYVWIELMIGNSRYVQVDPATGDKYVVEYSDFKRRTLLPAIERINSIATLGHTLELKERLSGLKVHTLQFAFIPKKQERLDLPLTWPENLVESLKAFGFTEDALAEMAQGYGLDEVGEALKRFHQMSERMQGNGKRIVSPKNYFESILRNVASEAEFGEEQIAALEKKAREEEAARVSAERQERAKHDFGKRQTSQFIESLAAWPEARRQELLSAFEASPEYPKTRVLLAKSGWDPKTSYGAWVSLKAWVAKEKPDTYEELLPNPEDRDLEAWLMWRLDNPGT